MKYFDYAATCPVDPRVLSAMGPYWSCANPASGHTRGASADRAVTQAREVVAESIGADPGEIAFTSGATEADNWAIYGYAAGRPGGRVVTQATEHAAILRPAERMPGGAVVLTVDGCGLVDLDELERAVSPGALVSVMAVNNETGTTQPIAEIGRICARAGAIYHCDATQAIGKMSIDVQRDGIHMLSMSSHKVYGPKGVGALYIRDGLEIEPMIRGGRQERGRRAGTTSVPLVVGFAEALTLFSGAERDRIRGLSDLLAAQSGLRRVGSDWAPGIVSLSAPWVGQGELLDRVGAGACCSAGSACSDGPSHVMAAMGVEGAVIRVCVGRQTTRDDVISVTEAIKGATQ